MRRLLFLLIIPIIIRAQSIVGEWSSYTSALALNELVQVDNIIYAASPGGLVALNQSDRLFKVFGPNDGLSYTDVQCLALDKLGCLWLGMSAPNGEINIWNPDTKQIETVYNATKFGEELTEIGTMTFDSDLAFVAYRQEVNCGLLYFKINRGKYEYQDFYPNFPIEFSSINHLAVIHDTLWVGTEVGLLYVDLTSDLKNPNNWAKVNLVGQDDVSSIIEYEGAVICSYGSDIFRIEGNANVVMIDTSLSRSIGQLLVDQSGELMAVSANGIYRFENNNWHTISRIATNHVLIDEDEIIWGATNRGLLKNSSGDEEWFVPNTVLNNGNTALYVSAEGQLVAASGKGISFNTADGWYNIVKDYFYIGIGDHYQDNWNYFVSDTIAFTLSDLQPIYSLIRRGDDYFASLFGSYLSGTRGGGLLRFNPDDLENYIVYDTTNGMLTASAGYGGADNYLAIGYMTLDAQENLWIANQFSQNDNCIAVLTPDNRWAHFSGTESHNYLNYLVTSIVFDRAGRVWFGSETKSGTPVANGGIAVLDYNNTLFEKSDDHWYWVSSKDGLASNSIFSLAFDHDERLWIMTAGGIQAATISDNFPNPVFSSMDYTTYSNIAFAKECRIKVDGLNDKWVTTVDAGVKVYTHNGVWLNDYEGFTTENSGLLSDKILDIAFDSPRGLVYISTNKGISVYRSPFAYYGEKYENVRVFPSPFRIPADKPLTIDNLLQDSEVKIMLLDGTLIRHLDIADAGEISGQQAFWDGRNENGKLVSSGVYIFIAYTPEGDTMTGKIAVLRR